MNIFKYSFLNQLVERNTLNRYCLSNPLFKNLRYDRELYIQHIYSSLDINRKKSIN